MIYKPSAWIVNILNFILFFNFTILYWFCHVSKWIRHMCSPSWTLLPPPSPCHPSGSSQCTSPKHPVSYIEPGLATRFIYDIIHVSMPFSQIILPSPSFFFNTLHIALASAAHILKYATYLGGWRNYLRDSYPYVEYELEFICNILTCFGTIMLE